MKHSIFIIAIFALAVCFNSCLPKCDCYNDPYYEMVSDYDMKRNIIQVNTVNMATGFQSYFISNNMGFIDDSASMAQICQSVINPIRFFDDETGYFFVESNKAWMVAHATKPDLIGTYRYNVEDIMGKFYVRDMVEAIEYKGYGFVSYYFDNPETGNSDEKVAFVKSIPQAEFFVGTGFYNYDEYLKHTPDEAAMKLVEEVTRSAGKGISGGMEIMPDSTTGVMFCRDFIDNIRFFDNQSGYFFIYDFNCVNVAHGTQKDLQGENLYDYQDSKGTYVIRELAAIAKNKGEGYFEYYWNNPVTGKEEPKLAFVYKLPGIDYFIGSGIYFE